MPVICPRSLRQLLANLVSNAAKHTPAGTTVTVAVTAALTAAPTAAPTADAGSAQLSVTDDGPGIPTGLQSTLFDRFVRGDPARSRSAGSTGLGLAIVDAVTTAHGGQVELISRPGLTTFAVTLPA